MAGAKLVGIRRGSLHDIETVKPGTTFTITLFGANLWPRKLESVWLTNADHCEVFSCTANINSHPGQEKLE